MARDLIPTRHRRRELSTRGGEESDPFFTLHREMNCLFENVFRGFDLAPFGSDRFLDRTLWPNIEVSETDKEIKVVAEVPGLEEKDIELELANGESWSGTRGVVAVDRRPCRRLNLLKNLERVEEARYVRWIDPPPLTWTAILFNRR